MDTQQAPSNRLNVHQAINSILPKEPNVAVIHSSIAHFKINDDALRWHFLSAISSLVDQGWTLLFPSFTFSFCSGTTFSVHGSPSETGILAELVLENLPASTRTNEPIYSFVVIGNRSNEVVYLKPKTVFGDGSPFEWLEKVNANVMMLGCSWKYCTQFHRYEELQKVDYRYVKPFRGQADYGNGLEPVECKMFVRDLELNPLNDFTPAIKSLDSSGLIKKVKLFDGSIQSAKVSDIRNTCVADLRTNPFVYLSNEGEVRKNLRDRAERDDQPTIKVSILGQKNLDLMSQSLRNHLSCLLPERRFNFLEMPYGQLYKKLNDEKDYLYINPPDIKIFSDRLEDIPGFDASDIAKTLNAVKNYANLIHNFHERTGGWSIVSLFSILGRPVLASDTVIQNDTVLRANAELKDAFQTSRQITWVDVNAEMSAFSGPVTDKRLEFLGQFPWSKGFSDHLAHTWASLIITMLAKDARLLIVDLDNTLWGGVLGEDGIEGLEIGGDYPGNAYKAFQELILKHSERGVALAIASKNDQDLALKAISELPDMMIREHHLQSYAINWKPKWQNIVGICEELSLGLGSVLFIDDNPVEREQVKLNLPDVKILPLPNDPAEYASALQSCAYLRPINLVQEDLGRLNDYSNRKKREQIRASSSNLENYYAELEISLSLNALNSENVQRAAQLCQKTNQFNSTTRRYDQKQLFDLSDSGNDVLVINYSDKFSPAENIGLLIIKYAPPRVATIDLYLLSCRVLGRGIETVIPKLAASIAGKKGCDRILAEIFTTERNTPAQSVFKDSGFSHENETLWQSVISETKIPSWIKYTLNLAS